jgi:hypothetical protein
MAQLRFGILPIQVETGHFRNIKLEDKICTLCQLEEIEDESHFLFRCSCYSNIRHRWLNNIQTKCENVVNLTEYNKLKLLFTDYHRCTAKFIAQCYTTRKSNLFVE